MRRPRRGLRARLAAGLLVLAVPATPTFAAVLFESGPLVTSSGTGAAGADESVLQNVTLGDGTLGVPHDSPTGQRVADDFTITDPFGWQIDTATFFAYQTGSGTNSTITATNARIWDGAPGEAGSAVVFGDPTTNRLAGSTFSDIYRVSEDTLGGTERPVMADEVTLGLELPPGTYWIDWQADGSLSSGPFAPPITIDGVGDTGNGRHFNGFSWVDFLDSESGSPKGFPFVLQGQVIRGTADLSVTKTATPDAVLVGESLLYTIDVTNLGPDDAHGVTVTDTLPADLDFVEATGTGWSCSEAGGVVTCTADGTIEPGPAPPITIEGLAPGTPTLLTNLVTVAATDNDDPRLADNELTLETEVIQPQSSVLEIPALDRRGHLLLAILLALAAFLALRRI